jgi:hypothetical protein
VEEAKLRFDIFARQLPNSNSKKIAQTEHPKKRLTLLAFLF